MANAFHDEFTVPTTARRAIIRMEQYVTQAFGITPHWPLLTGDATITFRPLPHESKEQISSAICGYLNPQSGVGRLSPPSIKGTAMDFKPPIEKEVQEADSGEQMLQAFPQLSLVLRDRQLGDFESVMVQSTRILSSSSGLPCHVEANLTAELAYAYQSLGDIPKAISWYRKAVEVDASLHSAYVLMAQLGLGPLSMMAKCPPSVREEVIEVLQSVIDDPTTNAAFRELCLYNLGAALYYMGSKEVEAKQVYRQIVNPVVGPGQTGFRKKTVFPVSLVVITVASTHTPQLSNLMESADAAGVDLRVLGLGQEYTGHEVKLRLYWEFVNNPAIADDQLVLAVDAYDVLLFPTIRELPMVFK